MNWIADPDCLSRIGVMIEPGTGLTLQCHTSRELITEMKTFLLPCHDGTDRESVKRSMQLENIAITHAGRWVPVRWELCINLSLGKLKYGRSYKYLDMLLFSRHNVKFK